MAKHLRPQIYVAIVAIVAMATVMSFSSRARTAFSSSARPSGAVAVSRTPSVRAYASSAQQFVDNGIKDNKVVIFSKSYCPYCAKAKTAMASVLPVEKFTVHEIEKMPECDAIQDALLALTGGRSVPRVFVNGKFIGGGDDTVALAANGELKKMLVAAGLQPL